VSSANRKLAGYGVVGGVPAHSGRIVGYSYKARMPLRWSAVPGSYGRVARDPGAVPTFADQTDWRRPPTERRRIRARLVVGDESGPHLSRPFFASNK